MKIQFVYVNVRFILHKEKEYKKSIELLVKEEGFTPGEVNIIFVNKKEILRINQEYLKHNYVTDVISFPEKKKKCISGEIYICVDQVKNNSKIFEKGDFKKEMKRVIIHGILHLIGYNDITESEKEIMRKNENIYLDRYFNI